MNKTAIGFHAGQFGDLLMNTVSARAFKIQYPDWKLTFAVGKPYEEILPLFQENPDIDDFHVWSGYEPWPSEEDQKFLNERNYGYIFNPFPRHKREDWFNHVRNQTEEACLMNGLIPPEDLSIKLIKWWRTDALEYKNCVALALFPSYGKDYKSQNMDRAAAIAKYIRSKGYTPIQIGKYGSEPMILGAEQCNQKYFRAIHVLLSCKFLITGDTGLSWAASGYKFPTLGLYGYSEGYYGLKSPKVYQPINPNAVYLESKNPNDIPLETIYEQIDLFLK